MPDSLLERRLPVFVPAINRFTANEKDFSLALEMTVREGCSHFPSMISGHKSLIYKETYIHARTF